MHDDKLNIGIIGAGEFAAFASKAFLQIPGIKIIAITDTNKAAARKMAIGLDAKVFDDIEIFLKDSRIDLVYIATPPYLHYEHSKKALQAGKHVICEKPAALKTSDAEVLKDFARSKDLLYVVNLMQRYNPLYEMVSCIIKEKMLGNFLHGFFENYASDENLDQHHWFWDTLKSGGIFIEHGVHFFDMFSGWLGEGKVINAVQLQRPGIQEKLVDRVQATVKYRDGTVNFYHGFDQPKILDRQEMRLTFERGEITLFEWVPVKMKIHGLFERSMIHRLRNLMGEFSELQHENKISIKKVKGRFTDIHFDEHITIEYGDVSQKQNRYSEILIGMLNDQWKWIRDRTHTRVIDDNNAVDSLRTAESATASALNF